MTCPDHDELNGFVKIRTLMRDFYSILFACNNSVIVGTDAGWWFPLLAQRQTFLPFLDYGSERGPRLDHVFRVNNLTAAIQEKGI